MKVPSSVSKVLTNKYVLYFVLFLAITNVLGYMVMGQFTTTLFFIIVAYLISNFSQNMIIVLGVALLLTNILMVGQKVKEGFESQKLKTKGSGSGSKTENIVRPIDDDKEIDEIDMTGLHTTSVALNASPEDAPDNDLANEESMNVMSNKKRNRIDYATTIENAYGDLNDILGSDGIKRLTDDTQKLMTQQLQLADAMKSMTPLLENAKSMMQGFDMKSLDGLSDLAKTFNPSK